MGQESGMTPREWEEHLRAIKARLADEAGWSHAPEQELAQLLFHGIGCYGTVSDEAMIAPLSAVYRHALTRLDVTTRQRIYDALKPDALTGAVSLNVYHPFLFVETDRVIVSGAVIDYVHTRPATADDPLLPVRDICGWIESHPGVSNRGALLAGIVCLGDQRAAELLREVKWKLTEDDVAEASKCESPRPSVAALKRLADSARASVFHDLRRDFGRNHERDGGYAVHLQAEFGLAEIAERCAARMHQLEADEPPVKIMWYVLASYGVEPRSRVEDRAELFGRKEPAPPH